MKKSDFTVKTLKINFPLFNFYPLEVEDSYVNALKYGAISGFIAAILIVTFISLLLV